MRLAAILTKALLLSILWSATSAFAAQQICINEVAQERAIELHNPTDGPVSLDGWGLTDSSAAPYAFMIPGGITIPANGYLVISRSELGFAIQGASNFPYYDNGTTVYLYGPGNVLEQQVKLGRLYVGVISPELGSWQASGFSYSG